MSQHALTIANQAGASFRSDIVNALQALGSLASGASAPSTTYAYMLWADTTTGFLKQRNAANSAWVQLFRMSDGAFLDSLFALVDDGDNTKKLVFQLSGIATGNTRTLTAPDANLTLAGKDLAQSYTAAQRGAYNVLTDGATITPDFALANHFRVQLGGNRTLANPTNLVAGQSGAIDIYQDSTGSRTLSYGWAWQFAGGTAPTLTTTARGKDKLAYSVDVYAQSTITVTIATPGVVTWNGHGLTAGQQVQLTTTGALPTGLSANTTYFLIPVDANSFQLSATQSGAAIATSGSQSGVHTMTAASITASLLAAVK